MGYIGENDGVEVEEIVDGVVEKEKVGVGGDLKIDGLGYNLLIECMELCVNRVRVGRRGVDEREVCGGDEREVKGRGNRSWGECEGM